MCFKHLELDAKKRIRVKRTIFSIKYPEKLIKFYFLK